jgi:hypothetical protein
MIVCPLLPSWMRRPPEAWRGGDAHPQEPAHRARLALPKHTKQLKIYRKVPLYKLVCVRL